jgi:2-polyprenyl-3-methyl-5-hydroxy-6-metoxy-1,4-benzoquinol methylase
MMIKDNLSEYQTPEVYDAEYGSYTDDFKFFLSLKDDGDALDLACGTGRITMALAKNGFNCVGLDASQAMIDWAIIKSHGLGITYIHGDMQDFHMDRKFDLITLTGNSFQVLISTKDQMSLITAVAQHLKKDGIFAFNTRNITESECRTTHDFEFWHCFHAPDAQVVNVYGKQTYNLEKQTVLYTTKRVWPDNETITKIELRFTPIQVIKELLDGAGLEIIHLYGDTNQSPLCDTSSSIYVACRLKDDQKH